MSKAVAMMLGSLLLFGGAQAEIINIPAQYPSIQEAIVSSSNGDTVLVAPGEYHERINYIAKDLTVASLFIIDGDSSYILSTVLDGDSSGTVVTFEGGESHSAVLAGLTIRNGAAANGGGILCQYGSSPKIYRNIITGNIAYVKGAGIACQSNSNPLIQENNIFGNDAPMFNFGDGGGGISILEAAPIIIGNDIHENTAQLGGGINCNASTPLIRRNNIHNNIIPNGFGDRGGAGIVCVLHTGGIIDSNEIKDNIAELFGCGGGFFINQSDPLICHNDVLRNRADLGGGYRIVEEATPVIIGNRIIGNTASGGGGMSLQLASPAIVNNLFEADSADEGGAMDIMHGSATVAGNLIIRNKARFSSSGGIHLVGHASARVYNNTLAYNESVQPGGGMYYSTFQDSTFIINNIFYFNTPDQVYVYNVSTTRLEYCNIQGGGFPGEGNIDVDPLFRDSAEGDFHLMSTACGDPFVSSCIDAGAPYVSDDVFDCLHGLGVAVSDLGAYGGGFNYVAGDANGNGTCNGIDVSFMVNYLKGSPNAPLDYFCPHIGQVKASADANGNCVFNGIDVTYLVSYLKSGAQAPRSCPDCPAGSGSLY